MTQNRISLYNERWASTALLTQKKMPSHGVCAATRFLWSVWQTYLQTWEIETAGQLLNVRGQNTGTGNCGYFGFKTSPNCGHVRSGSRNPPKSPGTLSKHTFLILVLRKWRNGEINFVWCYNRPEPSVVWCSEFLATNSEVPGSIPGATRFSE
jgi:hypothetical protein